VHRAVLEAEARESGATVHFVTERYDEGAIIAQIAVPVRPGDTDRTLADRVFAAERRLYPHVLEGLVAGRLPLASGGVERLTAEEAP
jgi:folate-dependent phosphoribosylglycinamide formyltransferase PurN